MFNSKAPIHVAAFLNPEGYFGFRNCDLTNQPFSLPDVSCVFCCARPPVCLFVSLHAGKSFIMHWFQADGLNSINVSKLIKPLLFNF